VVPKREKEEVIVVAIVVLVFARSVGRLVGGWRVGCMKSMDGGRWTDGRMGGVVVIVSINDVLK
jgi:hypothetical protein